MSVVTGIVLVTGVLEEKRIQELNIWLVNHNFGPLVELSSQSGGSKHPEFYLYCCGYNYFPEEDFVKLVLSCSWDYPENVVLVLNPQEGASVVCRPVGQS